MPEGLDELEDYIRVDNFTRAHLLAARFGSLVASPSVHRPGIFRQLLEQRARLVREDGSEGSPQALLEEAADVLWSAASLGAGIDDVLAMVRGWHQDPPAETSSLRSDLSGYVELLSEDESPTWYSLSAAAALSEAVDIAAVGLEEY